MKVLVTGAAGFIGSRAAEVLAENGIEVLGVDNLNDYYDPDLKIARLARGGLVPAGDEIVVSTKIPGLSFIRMDIRDERFEGIVTQFAPDIILHLAAQPGVRYSLAHPEECLESNIMSFVKILEICRIAGVRKVLYASSSSVYGEQSPHAFRETDEIDNPASIYAVSKRTNEMIANVYAETYGMCITGLRFFSVYGEWGRPDMAPYLFTKAILNGTPLTLYNGGQSSRDFTYIEDVVKCILLLVENSMGIFRTGKNHEILNIGHGVPTLMKNFVELIEELLHYKADVRILPIQPGDVLTTLSDTSKFRIRYGYSPQTSLRAGMTRFIEWFVKYNSKVEGATAKSCLSGKTRLA